MNAGTASTSSGERPPGRTRAAAHAQARLAQLVSFARRRGWRCLTDGRRLVLISPRGATVR